MAQRRKNRTKIPSPQEKKGKINTSKKRPGPPGGYWTPRSMASTPEQEIGDELNLYAAILPDSIGFCLILLGFSVNDERSSLKPREKNKPDQWRVPPNRKLETNPTKFPLLLLPFFHVVMRGGGINHTASEKNRSLSENMTVQCTVKTYKFCDAFGLNAVHMFYLILCLCNNVQLERPCMKAIVLFSAPQLGKRTEKRASKANSRNVQLEVARVVTVFFYLVFREQTTVQDRFDSFPVSCGNPPDPPPLRRCDARSPARRFLWLLRCAVGRSLSIWSSGMYPIPETARAPWDYLVLLGFSNTPL